MKKNWLKLAAIASVAFFVTACNTVEGMGQDIQTAGDKIEETADANK